MFFSISLKIAIILNMITILASLIVCFANRNSRIVTEMESIAHQCRWAGILYFVFAWFTGDGSFTAHGRTTYTEVAYWMLLVSIGWLIVFGISTMARLWSKHDTYNVRSLATGIIYFIIAYLLQ